MVNGIIKSVVLDQGRKEQADALINGHMLKPSRIQIGRSSWNPTTSDTELRDPIKFYPIADSRRPPTESVAAITAILDYDASEPGPITIGEIGIYFIRTLDNGTTKETLFSITSEEGRTLATIEPGSVSLLAQNIDFISMNLDAYELSVGERLNLYANDLYAAVTAKNQELVNEQIRSQRRITDLESRILKLEESMKKGLR